MIQDMVVAHRVMTDHMESLERPMTTMASSGEADECSHTRRTCDAVISHEAQVRNGHESRSQLA